MLARSRARARGARRFVSGLLAFLLHVGVAHAETAMVEGVDFDGIARTRETTLLDLLPRQPPAVFTDAEIVEVERRIDNLAIFDVVKVERRGKRLHVHVLEKWTLIPAVDFASGETLDDTYAMIGVTEYNTFGTANQAEVKLSHEQRGWGVHARYAEHVQRRNRWSFGVESSFTTSGYRFADGNGWRSTQGSAGVFMTSPPWKSDHANWVAALDYAREVIDDVKGPTRPPDSHVVRQYLGFAWDQYRWKDLVPSGFRGDVFLGTGMLFGPAVAQARHSLDLNLVGALPLGSSTVLMARYSGSVLTRGNPNFSMLLGSIQGVRGLEDSFYRNWIQTYANVELRHAIRIARRWAIQGVVFTDAALFESLNADGRRGDFHGAFSTGVGGRIVPTWLANTVLRVDGARLFTPEQRWFWQLGLSQYF